MTQHDPSRLGPPLIVSLTLGLAPFRPEPHVVDKLRRVVAGAGDMATLDWLDLVLHGAPWVWLLLTAFAVLRGAPAEEARSPPTE